MEISKRYPRSEIVIFKIKKAFIVVLVFFFLTYGSDITHWNTTTDENTFDSTNRGEIWRVLTQIQPPN